MGTCVLILNETGNGLQAYALARDRADVGRLCKSVTKATPCQFIPSRTPKAGRYLARIMEILQEEESAGEKP